MDDLIFYRRNAILANLCDEWNKKWSACHDDKEKLMRLVLSSQAAPHFATFCYNGAGLSKEYCLREFGSYLNGRTFANCDEVEGFTYAMYISPSEAKEIGVDVAQILWSNPMEVIIPQTKCNRLYISNKSSVHITLEGYNTVQVYLFDESELIIDDADDTCEVVVYKYSDKSKVERGTFCISPKVKIFNKTLKL